MARSSSKHGLRKIVSGGQTGADRGALDAAIALGIEHGGWCPKGRLAEDGVIPQQYQVTETRSKFYRVRTEQNVIDSDGTLIFYQKILKGGTELTRQLAIKHDKPHLLFDVTAPLLDSMFGEWLVSAKISVLNVAGPRESSAPGIATRVEKLLRKMLGD
jgi:hypothetical protein